LRCDLVTWARLAQEISARDDTRRYTARQKIDCPSFGKRLFWPPYRLLNANEFLHFQPILGATKKFSPYVK